jgi:hypothetical protein
MSDMNKQQIDQEIEDEAPWGPEEKRLRAIRERRKANQECIMCGKPLGFFDKWAKRKTHGGCTEFKE